MAILGRTLGAARLRSRGYRSVRAELTALFAGIPLQRYVLHGLILGLALVVTVFAALGVTYDDVRSGA